MTTQLDHPTLDADAVAEVAQQWLSGFAELLRTASGGESLLHQNLWWRDLLAFTGDLRSLHGRDKVDRLLAVALTQHVRGEQVDPTSPPVFVPVGEGAIRLLFRFDTQLGHVRGVASLVFDRGNWRARNLLTALDSLAGHESAIGDSRPQGTEMPEGRIEYWSARRERELDCRDRDPEVLVIGAGHSGLALAAHLGALGVRTLLVDRAERVGDNWRGRYDSLVLHDAVWSNHLPLMPFPPNWPVFTPKDKMGDWLELYSRAMELNVWTRSEVVETTFDPDDRRWTVVVDRDGTRRTLRSWHVVLATGLSGTEPMMPDFEGTEDFTGELLHSSDYRTDRARRGTRTVVIGTGNSGHDIAQDLHESGARVTLVQRGPTHVASGRALSERGRFRYGEHTETDVADLLDAAVARRDPQFVDGLRRGVGLLAEEDRDLLDGLTARGFVHNSGPDGAGVMMLFLTRNGGYYIDVGASPMIVDGRIGLASGAISRLVSDGLILADGTYVPADTIVCATGFRGILETARNILGDDVADACTPVWGLDDEGELRSVWRRSGHDRFWLNGGNFMLVRNYSKYLALQIKADLAGIELPGLC
ncbi:NAD(P)/FAD-dependent oxidoreductase [Rhodococcus sp. D2-41]|uniref:flavin-containing monooxygenase n=1 Tax=Speluncibacter jeojiensis TaxID=2710754 RepID=UPI00241032F2|nr:NAD(P)/FAD-dependent oxidoreductase [Rhodococcus sp. D2-41]MDG3012194.1 NAD(P)/FAD-dependent oxidoreductase [Rhodococcus sp. D2-41]